MSGKLAPLFTSHRQTWRTPRALYEASDRPCEPCRRSSRTSRRIGPASRGRAHAGDPAGVHRANRPPVDAAHPGGGRVMPDHDWALSQGTVDFRNEERAWRNGRTLQRERRHMTVDREQARREFDDAERDDDHALMVELHERRLAELEQAEQREAALVEALEDVAFLPGVPSDIRQIARRYLAAYEQAQEQR